MTDQLPAGWENDFDLYAPEYLEDPAGVWRVMRERCPVARTGRRGGAVLPVRHADIAAIAHAPEIYSSRAVEATGPVPRPGNELKIPPITSDLPEHRTQRRVLLPLFNRGAVDALEPATRRKAAALADAIVGSRAVDAADAFAQHIPIAAIAEMLGLPAADIPRFSGWIVKFLKEGQTDQTARKEAIDTITSYFAAQVRGGELHGDGVIADLLRRREDEHLAEDQIVGMCFLLLVAGIDTTWSAIGASLWHLAVHQADRRRLAADPGLIPGAVEEFLRAYAPITIGRIAAASAEISGCPVELGDRVLLTWGAANRDPEAFDDPDRVIIDRGRNPHLAFGLGIHRCLGSGLARMEIRVALEEWFKRIPEFTLDPAVPVRWTGGNVRGPETLHLLLAPGSGCDGERSSHWTGNLCSFYIVSIFRL
jgi:cytochrome P450